MVNSAIVDTAVQIRKNRLLHTVIGGFLEWEIMHSTLLPFLYAIARWGVEYERQQWSEKYPC
jgi:hypothetical protein